ncbi:MAG: toxin-antitoxin system HicB family antitoxin [Acidobacteriota bacterium]
MSTLSVELPTSLHRHLKEPAERQDVSMNPLISSVVGEKLAALMTVEYLQERAKRGTRKRFEEVLARVSDREPEDFDRLSHKSPGTSPLRQWRRR